MGDKKAQSGTDGLSDESLRAVTVCCIHAISEIPNTPEALPNRDDTVVVVGLQVGPPRFLVLSLLP